MVSGKKCPPRAPMLQDTTAGYSMALSGQRRHCDGAHGGGYDAAWQFRLRATDSLLRSFGMPFGSISASPLVIATSKIFWRSEGWTYLMRHCDVGSWSSARCSLVNLVADARDRLLAGIWTRWPWRLRANSCGGIVTS